jgi:hypothetical protein
VVELDVRASGSGEGMVGRRFGRLVVIGAAGRKNHRVAWLCVCDCGRQKRIRGDSLRSGNTTSCGCYSRELLALNSRKRAASLSR